MFRRYIRHRQCDSYESLQWRMYRRNMFVKIKKVVLFLKIIKFQTGQARSSDTYFMAAKNRQTWQMLFSPYKLEQYENTWHFLL